MNFHCATEKNERRLHRPDTPLDRGGHAAPITGEEALYEASRCLGTLSCEACDLCRLLCPDLAVTRDPATGDILIDLEYCKGCGICAAVCPKGAITMVAEPENR